MITNMIILIKISRMITLKTPYWSSWLWCMKICVCVIPKSDQLAAQVVQATSADRAHRRQSGFDQSQFSWWLAIRPITSRLIGATCENNAETMVQSIHFVFVLLSVCICPIILFVFVPLFLDWLIVSRTIQPRMYFLTDDCYWGST